MNILLLGSGGREHALAWKLAQSPRCSELYIAPGNAGTAGYGKNIALDATDFPGLKAFCLDAKIDMVVVGPEEPLVKGIYNSFWGDPEVRHIPVIGPSKTGAQLEGSKAFAKAFMQRQDIPTAAYREFSDMAAAKAYVQTHPLPVVIKADGLAAGKGVIIAQSHAEATEALDKMHEFGEAGSTVVIEAFLDGVELSVFVLTDGQSYRLLPEAKDYKRIGEGDKGPNTGGMGAVSPVPFAGPVFMEKVINRIVEPTIEGLAEEEIDYKGFIFLGLINVGGEPYVIEYNCRMGDPETEVVMPRLRNDLVDLLEAVAEGRLDEVDVQTDPRTAVTTVAVSEGYPGSYPKDRPITGLPATLDGDVLIFQAGTRQKEGQVLTNGGRVLAATAYGSTIGAAAAASRAALRGIHFQGMYFRKDIGYEFE